MPTVWDESRRQAEGMLKLWTSPARIVGGFNTTEDDTRTLALHVLAYAAFQKSYPFSDSTNQDMSSSKPLSYRDSIAIILKNAILILAFPHAMLSWSIMPKPLSRVGDALSSFRVHMVEQIANERELLQNSQAGSGNVVSSYVQASANSAVSIKPLTEDEIFGNIFLLNFAGHDTTAITMSYGMALLAVYSEVQEWIQEEVDYYSKKGTKYDTLFPKLKRTQAVLLETLRLYNPIPGVPKWTDRTTTTELNVLGKKRHIPPGTLVIPNMQASHTHPRNWGANALQWRPKRWIITDGPTLEAETLFEPKKGTYFPFADGIRNCLGKKFAVVEWVATLSLLFKDHYIEPVSRQGESMEATRRHLLETVKDSNLKLLMSIRKPHDVVLRWKPRT